MPAAFAKPSRKTLMAMFILAVLMAVGTYIRLRGLDDFAPNVDEMMHLLIADGRDLGEVWKFSLLETHPPLGHFVRYFWQMTGEGIWHARLLSVLLGLAAIPVYYLLGREVGGRKGGLLAAAIAAFGHEPIVQSELVRNYALFIMFIAGTFLVFLRLREKWSTGSLVVYTLLGALSLSTHYGAVLLIMAVGLVWAWQLWKERRFRELATWLAANSCLGVLFLLLQGVQRPYLQPMMANQFPGAAPFPFSIIQAAWNLGSAAVSIVLPFVGILALVYALFYLYRTRKAKPVKFQLAILLVGSLTACILHAVHVYPADDHARRHLWLMPVLAALGASALNSTWQQARETEDKKSGNALPDSFTELAEVLVPVILLLILLMIVFMGENRDSKEFTTTHETLKGVKSQLTTSMQPGDVLLADFHVALYFFQGERNLYRERFSNFGKQTIIHAPLGAGTVVTQPNRRYIQRPIDYSVFAVSALADRPRPPGWKVWLVNWAASNPAQKGILECTHIEKLEHHEFRLPKELQKGFDGQKLRPEATVYAVDGEYFIHEVIAPEGASRTCIGPIP